MKHHILTLLVFGVILSIVVAGCARPTATPVPVPAPVSTIAPTVAQPTAAATDVLSPTAPQPTATVAQPTAAPSSTPTPEPTAEATATATVAAMATTWGADGEIMPEEYTDSVEAAGVTFHWATDGTSLFGALSAETTGWVAVGLRPEQQMAGASFIFGYVADGETQIFDMFGVRPTGPGSHPPDTELGGTNDVIAYGGSEEDGRTVIEFQIPLDSGDPNDKPLAVGETYDILLAYGANDDLNYHAQRGRASITLDEPEGMAEVQDEWPEMIALPNGFQPEGIAIGRDTTFYVGSIPTGAVFQGDLETGEGEVLVEPQEGRAAIGLFLDERTNYLFVAGGPTGSGFIYDAETGEDVALFTFTEENSFVNDVVVSGDSVYFTDSSRPVLYRVPLTADGMVPDGAEPEEIDLSGEYTFVADSFNANGIEATPDGEWLIVVHSARGELYRVDPDSGEATLIDLGGETMNNGDGILLDGQTLYVVQNRMNQIAVVELDEEWASGEVVETITDPAFRVPTTIAQADGYLYAVNARFGTEATASTEYEVVRVAKP